MSDNEAVLHFAGMLGNQHVLRTRGFSSRYAARRPQVPHRLLPVGAGDVTDPGILLLHAVPCVASLQRAIRNQHQQPGRGCRHHPECSLSGTTRKNYQVHWHISVVPVVIVVKRKIRYDITPCTDASYSDFSFSCTFCILSDVVFAYTEN